MTDEFGGLEKEVDEAVSKTTQTISQNNGWGSLAGIRNEHLSDTNKKHYHCVNLPGGPPQPMIVASLEPLSCLGPSNGAVISQVLHSNEWQDKH
jgi:hypothetical protein